MWILPTLVDITSFWDTVKVDMDSRLSVPLAWNMLNYGGSLQENDLFLLQKLKEQEGTVMKSVWATLQNV